MPFSGKQVNGALDILDGGTNDEGPSVDLDAKQAVCPVNWCIFEFVKGHRVLPVVNGGIAEEDANGFDAGHNIMINALMVVDLCIDVAVNVHGVGHVDIMSIRAPYSGVERDWVGLNFLATNAVLPQDAIKVVGVLCADGLLVKELLGQILAR